MISLSWVNKIFTAYHFSNRKKSWRSLSRFSTSLHSYAVVCDSSLSDGSCMFQVFLLCDLSVTSPTVNIDMCIS